MSAKGNNSQSVQDYMTAYSECFSVVDNSGNMEILIRKLAETQVLIDETEQYYNVVRGGEQTGQTMMAITRLRDLRTAKNQLIRACNQRMGSKIEYSGVSNAPTVAGGEDPAGDKWLQD